MNGETITKLIKLLKKDDDVLGYEIMGNGNGGFCVSIRFRDNAGYENSKIFYEWDFTESFSGNVNPNQRNDKIMRIDFSEWLQDNDLERATENELIEASKYLQIEIERTRCGAHSPDNTVSFTGFEGLEEYLLDNCYKEDVRACELWNNTLERKLRDSLTVDELVKYFLGYLDEADASTRKVFIQSA